MGGAPMGDTSYTLGGWSGNGKDGSLNTWKPNSKVIKATINFTGKHNRRKEWRKQRRRTASSTIGLLPQLTLYSHQALGLNTGQRLSCRLRSCMTFDSQESTHRIEQPQLKSEWDIYI